MELVLKIAVILFSIIIHEVSHGYVALALGDKTAKYAGRLTLNPIKHIDPFGTVILPILLAFLSAGNFIFGWAKPVPYNPYNLSNQKWGDAIVAAAGPISNLIIVAIFAIALRVGIAFNMVTLQLFDISAFIITMNLVLAFFNLIPIAPLDGSKVLFAFLPYRLAHVRHIIERYSFILLLIFIFILWDYFAIFIGFLAHLVLP